MLWKCLLIYLKNATKILKYKQLLETNKEEAEKTNV